MTENSATYPKKEEQILTPNSNGEPLLGVQQPPTDEIINEILQASDGLVGLGQVLSMAEAPDRTLTDMQVARLGCAVLTIGDWLSHKVSELEEPAAASAFALTSGG